MFGSCFRTLADMNVSGFFFFPSSSSLDSPHFHNNLFSLSLLHRVISFRSGPTSGQRLMVKTLDPEAESHPSPAVTDPGWLEHGAPFKEVNLEKLEGRNLASKIDMLMAHLSMQ